MIINLDLDFFNRLINSLDIPVFVKDRQHRWLLLNDRMCSMFGVPRDALIGKSDYEFFPKDQADIFWQKDEEVFRSGSTNENEEYFTDQNGKKLTIITRKSPFTLSSGDQVLVGFIIDVTKLREGERALSESQNLFTLAIEGADLAVWDWSIETNVTYFCDRWKSMLGYQSSDLENIATTFFNLIHHEDRPLVEYELKRYMQQEIPHYSVEFRMKRKDGGYHWIHSRGRIFERDRDGKPLRMVGTHLDIHKQKLREEELHQKISELNTVRMKLENQAVELQRARQIAEESSKAKSEFLAHMSHEIRTPMNGVMGMADLLKESTLSDEQKELVGSIIFSGRILLSVINDILDFSKIEAQKIEIINETFDMRMLLEGLEKSFTLFANNQGVSLSVLFDSTLPRYLVGDSARMQQILTNMIGNALKFTPAGGCVLLNINGEQDVGDMWKLRFDIYDSGIGIEESVQTKILDAFEQAESSLSRRYGGTGLGLAISNRLIKMMGGNLSVHSKIGAGSTFSFILPFKLGSQKDINLPFGDQKADLLPLNVLVAEDNIVNQKVITKILERSGHNVVIAPDGGAAIEHLKKQCFDIVLMDIQMPGMDGVTATKLIRSNDEIKNVPIIALTAHALYDERESYAAAGMDGYIAKPIDQREMYLEIARVLQKSAS